MTSPRPGDWPSPITPEGLVDGALGISEAIPDGDTVWWAESRPSEGGRTAIMRAGADGAIREITPSDANVRTTVHEYGGGAWWAENGTLWYVEQGDQRVRALSATAADAAPVVLTPAPPTSRAWRYAELRPVPGGEWLIAVCERHASDATEPENLLVAIAQDGSGRVQDLVRGADFVGPARVSPDGSRLAWIEWDHPNMPWDTTRLQVAPLVVQGETLEIGEATWVAGGEDEAIVQPEFAPDGTLHYLSDRDQAGVDTWQLYREGGDEPVLTVAGEIGYPPWVFGLSRYAFRPDGSVVAARFARGIDHVDGLDGYTAFHAVRSSGARIALVAASFASAPAVLLDGEVVFQAPMPALDPAFLPAPEALTFATTEGDEAYALYYAPAHPDHALADGERAPLVLMAHGGPTSAARSQLNLGIRFWTSRGFGVVDVNYRGSSGYGRRYRRALYDAWGVKDVDDCVAVARHLVARGTADPERLAIRGGSAGGFTVLCALAFHDVFTAGCSLYGVADLEALAGDTHKFESRYLDSLVGPWPEARDTYRARSPIHHLDGFDTPMIVLQGSDDKVVPPNQSRMIVEALRARDVPVEYLEFEGEAHGFRRAETLVQALNAELAFYRRQFGLAVGVG